MGAWGGFVVFDVNKFKNTILPALMEGEKNPLVKEAILKIHNYKYNRRQYNPDFINMKSVLETFEDCYMFSSLRKSFAVQKGVILNEDIKLNYFTDDFWGYEDFAELFELLLTVHCFEYIANFGLSFNHLISLKFNKSSLGNYLKLKLSNIDNFWRHNGGGWGEGIHGWLDEKEAQLFNSEIEKLELDEEFISEDESSLANLKKFKLCVNKAAELNKGILWGADLKLLYANIDWSYNPGLLDVTPEIIDMFMERNYCK